ncbi:hypothetical protein ATJ97_1383 [Georgenia soli]|uniref:ATP synthase E subunit n=1 Tax=Georgenia soli TaxID=638953 RepID=A0A2A9EJ99_9MICO|nr:hypothetical protein [Georgenia soli]PFG38893.1 hypothetical protein ATJ97_1383 [Georgenia soli]
MTTTQGAAGPPVTPERPGTPPDPLAPVRAALLEQALADAAATGARADADAEALLARARSEAEAVREAARAEGRADGLALVGAERARARREARGVVLAAQRQVFEDLTARVRDALPRLRDDPAYPAWHDRAVAQIRAALGPDAAVTKLPEGGVSAEAAGRRAVVPLAALAGRAVEAVGPEGLWAP